MLSKDHSHYDPKKCSKPLNLAQVSQDPEALQNALKQANQWAEQYATPDAIPDKLIPDIYDLRNLAGVDLTPPVRDQEHCGSCHALSFI